MTSRFADTTIGEQDVILTTKASQQVPILLGQLINRAQFRELDFDMQNSPYFLKHYDESMQKAYQVGTGGHESVKDLAANMEDSMREDHFEEDAMQLPELSAHSAKPGTR